MTPAALILAAALFVTTAAHAAEPLRQVRGAHGFICRTVEAAVEFNQATAFLSDAEFDEFAARTTIPCRFGVIDGGLVKVEEIFLRRDQVVVEVWQYRPAVQLTSKFYVFVAVSPEEGMGM